ncbi:GPI mannosyltransferase 4 [Phytophthora citrophthora]|uniref:Mannosyltransferase n=1 Tax=Phytophthora citrophthora TaxID=4793 RepID=A0AAD9LPP0_9STRA|nr:GPI mannosyltransferase 4 [Phytophthora citrophthora]
MTRRTLYAAVAVLRVVGSVLLLGMVHPDEFFQSQEVMARHVLPESSVLHRELFIPWEFQLPTPNRSIIFPALVVGLPLKILEWVGVPLTGFVMLVTPRLLLCLLSFIIDAVLYQVVGILSRHLKPEVQKEKQEKALLLFASSWPTLVFLCRPFSNTFETLVLALCFAVLFLVNPHRRALCGIFHVQTVLLGSLLAFGFFTRFTFPVFFFPIGLELVRQQDAYLVRASRKKDISSSPSVVRRVAATTFVALQGLVAFLLWAAVFIIVDTIYFQGVEILDRKWEITLDKIVIAPLNNLQYNMKYDNLELHGVHPRFTHLTVNMPMLFGPIFLVYLVRFLRFPDRSIFNNACVFFPLVCLSLAPHQEPRFLLPLIVPLHLFTAVNGRTGVVRFLTKHKLGKMLWILFNFLLTLFFGLLHQGGIIPMLLSLSMINSKQVENPVTKLWMNSLCNFDKSSLEKMDTLQLVFSKTYMPPRFLLAGMTPTPTFQVIDTAGKDPRELLGTDPTAFLVLPASVEATEILPQTMSALKLGGCFPHISTEDLALNKPFSLELYLLKRSTEK